MTHRCGRDTRGVSAPSYLHAERLPALPAAVDELLKSISVFGPSVCFLQLLLDVLLDLGVDEVPRLQTLEDRGTVSGAFKQVVVL